MRLLPVILSSMNSGAADAGLFGSIDANRGDYQNGWDTDQFPTNLYEMVEAMLVILKRRIRKEE